VVVGAGAGAGGQILLPHPSYGNFPTLPLPSSGHLHPSSAPGSTSSFTGSHNPHSHNSFPGLPVPVVVAPGLNHHHNHNNPAATAPHNHNNPFSSSSLITLPPSLDVKEMMIDRKAFAMGTPPQQPPHNRGGGTGGTGTGAGAGNGDGNGDGNGGALEKKQQTLSEAAEDERTRGARTSA